jgi:hypothetical protein
MKLKYFNLVPYISILCIILLFSFPLLRFRDPLSDHVGFWLWGFAYIPFIEGINIFDIILKVLSVWFIIELGFHIISIFDLKAEREDYDTLSSKWFKWGIINLLVLLICILWYFFVIYPEISSQITMIFIDVSFYLTIAYSLSLIFMRYLYKKYYFNNDKKKNYSN